MHSEVNQAIKACKNGNLILFPSDTSWCIGCDASNTEAVSKLLNLAQIENWKVTCFVADDRMLQKYIKEIPYAAQSIIDVADTPTTIVYDSPKNIALNLVRKDNTIAIRIPDDELCYQLSRRLNGGIAAAVAKISGTPLPKSFKEIAPAILKDVDYVVNLQKEKIFTKHASVIQIKNSGIVRILSK